MKRFSLEVTVYIDAEDADEAWDKFRESGLHEDLNNFDASGCYYAEMDPTTEVTK
tara:strand:- start:35682 stop:35846 length:165 start_codon:yes stop_codon:yes gene_type:complete